MKVACDLRILLLLMLLMLPTAAFVVAWFSVVETAVAAARSNKRPSLRKCTTLSHIVHSRRGRRLIREPLPAATAILKAPLIGLL